MTILTSAPRNEYTATAGQTVFNYTFKIYADSDLNVYHTLAGQEESESDLITAYTVSGVGNENGGSITLTTGASLNDLITIVSAIPESRTTDYQNNGDFLPDTVNNDFDRVVSLVKQVSGAVLRTLRFNEATQNASAITMDIPAADKYFRWDGTAANVEFVSGAPFDVPIDELYERVWAFNTVADVIAEATLAVGMSVKTHGYSTAGDGDGSHYKIVAGGTGTHDAVNYINLTASGLQALRTPLVSITETYTTAGTAPNFTVAASPTYGAYAANQLMLVKFNAAGTTGSNTLNRDGLGAKNLKQYDLTGAKIPAVVASGMLTYVEYDGTDQVILNPLPTGASTPTVHINTTQTLTSAHWGKTVVIDAAVTVTLPLLSGVPNGTEIVLKQGAADTTVISLALSGSDAFAMSGTLVSTLKMTRFGDFLRVVADTDGARWQVVADGIMGPSFEAHTSATQVVTAGTTAKLQFNSETSDPWGYYDPTTNYRFTPGVPGFYQITASAYGSSANEARWVAIIYKNGSAAMYGSRHLSNNLASDQVSHVSATLYLNGTTDYIECYGGASDQDVTFSNTIPSRFTAMRVR